MAMTLVQLTDIFRQLILDHFRGATADGDDGPFLAFELGTPVPDEMFHLPLDNPEYSPALALEYLSYHSNVAPRIRDSMFMHTRSTVDGQYEMLLIGSTPVDSAGADLFAAIRSAAGAAFDETLGSSVPPGIGRFRPVHADPMNWYDQRVADNWTTLSIDANDRPVPVSTRSELNSTLSTWRVADAAMQPLLTMPVSMQAIEHVQSAMASQPGNGVFRAFRSHSDICDAPFDPRNTERLFDCPTEPSPDRPRPPRPTFPSPPPMPPPPAPPVTSDGFSLKVDVCLVHLRRPWLSTGLLTLTNWFVPSVPRGTMSGGKGADDTGSFAVLPIACVFIRNLVITARWSEDDLTNVVTSSHLGAFSLLGRTFDHSSASLTVPGMQCVAWLCESLPVLPPSDKL